MKIKKLFVPESRLGWYSILGIFLVVIFMFLERTIKIAQGPMERSSFFSDPLHAILLILAGLSGASAFVIGLIAVIKDKERAIPVFLTTLLGLFITLFGLGEILSPH